MVAGEVTNKDEAVLLILLKAGLWEKEPDNLSHFPLSDESWAEVYRLAQRQTVTGLVYQGLCLLPDKLLPSEPQLMRWVARADAIERSNRRMNGILARLCGMFEENGLTPVLQKGQGVASLYENPLLRECGDIDLYFPKKEERQYAASLVRKSGWHIKNEADGSACYEWNGVQVEHHPRLFDINNPFVQDSLKKVEHVHGYRTALLPDGTEITVPSPLLNLLLMNTHIMKHAFGWGIGLRQLCDMARACYSFRDTVNPLEVKTLYHKTGIGKWSRLLHSFLQDYLGLPPAFLPYEEEHLPSRPLFDIILRGGNFGQYAAGRSNLSQSMWKRKLHTSRSFLSNACFSYGYAPKEAFWTFINLSIGQANAKRILFPGSGFPL